ncbi:MAG: MBL fold metallo-hydrolase [Lapillicoccus sp.]
MATAIRVEMLPARLGDCLLVECLRTDGTVWRMLVDGGPPDTWPLLEARLRRLGPADRRLDVVVVTHIDSDHIGGMVPFFGGDLARDFLDVGDVWFNGLTHLGEPGAPRSVPQGESVVAALLGPVGGHGAPGLPWNRAFGGGPVLTPTSGMHEVTVDHGPRITVLSPPEARLEALRTSWTTFLQRALSGRDRGLRSPPDVLAPLDDLRAVAATRTPTDASIPNGSSIALLVEHRGASLVLGADAFGPVLAAGLKAVATARGLEALPVDAVKLPHHGSKSNVVASLVSAAPARHYLVSSNGDTFHHPDDAALARVVVGAPPGMTLGFNYRNARTQRWADPALTSRYGHAAAYPSPGGEEAGYVLELPARD